MKKFLVFLFLCASFATHAQDKKLDSLYQALENHSQKDTLKVMLLNELGDKMWGVNPQKIKWYSEQALRLATELKHTRGIGDSYCGIARYYWSQTEHNKTIEFAQMAIKEYEKCNYLKGIGWCYGTIGLSYSQANDHEKSIEYLLLALKLNKQIGNNEGIARDYNILGCVYELKKEYQRALKYFMEALDMQQEIGKKEEIIIPLANVGNIHLLLGNYKISKQYFTKSLTWAKEVENKNLVAYISQSIGVLFYKIGNHEEAETYLHTALHLAHEIGDKKRKEETYQALADLEESRKNYKAAFHYQQKLQGIKDTLYSEDRTRQSANMETRYQTEKKEQAIILLEQQAKNQTLWRNSLVAGLLLTLIAAVVIYALQRSRTRKAKLLLETQQLLNHQLQEADQLKSRFFANISHEFRTPLTLIISPIEEKLAPNFVYNPEKEKISFQSIRRSANRLLELINQVLELSKLESGFMKLHLQPGNLYSFLMPILSSFDSMADVGQVQYLKEVRIPEYTVLFDGDKLEKILNNLLANAFKFSPRGGKVELKAVATEKEGTIEMAIEINNTSFIPSGTLDKIFEPFYQGDDTPARGVPGTGLGLSLVKELVKLHGGTVQVTSTATEGTTFTVTIPLERSGMPAVPQAIEQREPHAFAEEVPENISTAVDADKETILIVEDNQDVRNLVRQGLEEKYNILEATTGKEGVAVANENTVDLVVSDVMMPVMGGVELCHLLKNDERTSHIPVILLTARADHESKLEGLRTGADDYVVKPFNMQELQARIANLIGQRKKLVQKYQQHVVVQPHEITVTPLDERFIQKAVGFVEANLDNTQLTPEKMAEELGMGRTNLHRKLKAITGLSTSEFIQDFRLRRAALLIEKKADSISQIAYQVGFNDQSYFTKCFKKKFGKVPSEFLGGE
jgi:signal transduction histidine kinase/DNA-binding response OmpR family regulator